jgi:hypothetical protein
MRKHAKLLKILGPAFAAALAMAVAAGAVPATADHPEQFTGSLVNMVAGARFSQPFILSIDRYSSAADVQRFASTLSSTGAYSLVDELWRQSAGYVSVGGRLGYPVSVVLANETPAGRTIHVVMNRVLSPFEVQYYTRSSRYPFAVIELNLDKNGRGDGRLIAAARLRWQGDTLEIESLGNQPFRLLAVQTN